MNFVQKVLGFLSTIPTAIGFLMITSVLAVIHDVDEWGALMDLGDSKLKIIGALAFSTALIYWAQKESTYRYRSVLAVLMFASICWDVMRSYLGWVIYRDMAMIAIDVLWVLAIYRLYRGSPELEKADEVASVPD